ncbi:MAG TPA: hypothetical protein VLX31_08190 [Streptosporangiaceae bacterium]|nr:hypothetical protein [Streptosporangiaceae bacterium]
MSEEETAEELRAQLVEVEQDLESARRSAADIRSGVGDAEDPADRGALIQSADEQDTIADQLVIRREDLLRRISQA